MDEDLLKPLGYILYGGCIILVLALVAIAVLVSLILAGVL